MFRKHSILLLGVLITSLCVGATLSSLNERAAFSKFIGFAEQKEWEQYSVFFATKDGLDAMNKGFASSPQGFEMDAPEFEGPFSEVGEVEGVVALNAFSADGSQGNNSFTFMNFKEKPNIERFKKEATEVTSIDGSEVLYLDAEEFDGIGAVSNDKALMVAASSGLLEALLEESYAYLVSGLKATLPLNAEQYLNSADFAMHSRSNLSSFTGMNDAGFEERVSVEPINSFAFVDVRGDKADGVVIVSQSAEECSESLNSKTQLEQMLGTTVTASCEQGFLKAEFNDVDSGKAVQYSFMLMFFTQLAGAFSQGFGAMEGDFIEPVFDGTSSSDWQGGSGEVIPSPAMNDSGEDSTGIDPPTHTTSGDGFEEEP